MTTFRSKSEQRRHAQSTGRIPTGVTIPTTFVSASLLPVLSSIHYLAAKERLREVNLDFSRCIKVLESAMLPLLPILDRHRIERNTNFTLTLPRDPKIAAVFERSNWAHFIDPFRHPFTQDISRTHCSVIRYSTADEQFAAVDNILKIILNSTEVTRDTFRAIEWSLNEITDNVLNHAGKDISGYVQATWFRKNKHVEFIVADSGIGIPRSLSEPDHRLALEKCIQEGVTRNTATNQGNGLYGSFRIAQVAKGMFSVLSQRAQLILHPSGDVKIAESKVPYTGTAVLWNMRTDVSDVLPRALVFSGQSHDPAFDYLERISEQQGGRITVKLKEKFPSLGSRQSGARALIFFRNLLLNDAVLSLEIDFTNVNVISSSFADEVFGRLFVELGPMDFMQRVRFTNADAETLALINRAMVQRSGMSKQ